MSWSRTYYEIEGKKRDLDKICSLINDFFQGNIQPPIEGSDKEWEGNVLLALGAKWEDIKDKNLYGFFQLAKVEEEGELFIVADEYSDMTDFKDILNELVSGLKVYYFFLWDDYRYETNDPIFKYFPRYVVYAQIDGRITDKYLESRKESNQYAAKLMKIDKKTCTQKEINAWNEQQNELYHTTDRAYRNYIKIYKVKVVKDEPKKSKKGSSHRLQVVQDD